MMYDDYASLLSGATTTEHRLDLKFSNCSIALESNSRPLLDELAECFSEYRGVFDQPTLRLRLIESDPLLPPPVLADWPRPIDKGRKEAVLDLTDARLIHKVRTGVLFLQGHQRGIAVGELSDNLNQVINFINNQTISHWKREGFEICHAAALQGSQGIVALAGFSGGGKSTLMLHMMAAGGYHYVSNDRLLIQKQSVGVWARGVAKMPRVNPGTLLNNPSLTALLPKERATALAALPMTALWDLEEKYDVPIADVFGAERITDEGYLSALVILDWHHESDMPTTLEHVQLRDSPYLLEALMKSPGPFHADNDGVFTTGHESLNPRGYLDALFDIPTYVLRGKIDFAKAVSLCEGLLAPATTESADETNNPRSAGGVV